MTKKVLFICTGNYYRSRFAELLFSALASGKNLNWNANSRGFELGTSNIGPVYSQVLEQLKILGFPAEANPRGPVHLELGDLEAADLVVALNEFEHRPLMSDRFERWADRTIYWDVPDLDFMTSEDAFARIEKHVAGLIRQLQNHQSP